MTMRRREFVAGAMALPLVWTPAHAYQIPVELMVAKAAELLMRTRGCQVGLIGEQRNPKLAKISPIGSRWIFTTPTQIDVNGLNGQTASARLAPNPMDVGITRGAKGESEDGHTDILPPRFMRLVLDAIFRLGRIEPIFRNLNIDVRARRLALFEGRVVQVLGSATIKDRRRGQIWIDQETFQVARVMGTWGGQIYDLRLKQWDGPTTEGRFPHSINLLTQGRWIRRLETNVIRQATAR